MARKMYLTRNHSLDRILQNGSLLPSITYHCLHVVLTKGIAVL